MRDFCDNCHFLKMRCICHAISQIHHQTQIIVVRYPKEALHPFNTINLAKHNFIKLKIFDTEFVDKCEEFKLFLNQFINPILLLPNNHSVALNSDYCLNNKIDCIVLLDGTWNKAKKIYFQSHLLQGLTSVHLETNNLGKYLVRKSNFNGGISSIESIVETLKIIEKNLNLEKALDSFHFMNENQIKFKQQK